MRLHRGHNSDERGGPNLTSLIDMLFLLIIFFLVSSAFVEEEKDLEVELARARSAPALTAPQSPVVLNVRRDGSVLLGSQPIDPADLLPRLRALQSDPPGRPVQIRGDRRVPSAYLVAVHAAVGEAGFRRVDYKCLSASDAP